jgi:hypothetical protein
MPIQPYALGATKGNASTTAPITPPRSTARPMYLIIDYVALNGPQQYQDCGPALVTTVDYLTFYAVGRADAAPLPVLGYEVLHTYPHTTNLIGAHAHYIAWKSTLWRTP